MVRDSIYHEMKKRHTTVPHCRKS